MRGPDYRNRSPSDIVTQYVTFDSAGYVYRGLSWLDYAKRHTSVLALGYAALETRRAIEQLFFEELVMSVGGQLASAEYTKCKGNATKLGRLVRKLSPDYERLVSFTRAIMALLPVVPNLIVWDHTTLLKHQGAVSRYVHWDGAPADTSDSPQWFVVALETIGGAATYLWENMQAGDSGIMMPDKMQPEIRHAWDEFRLGRIDLDSVRVRAGLALPILSTRAGT